MTVSFGTVASANAYKSFAPLRMIPPCSCCVPGRNPGTSTNVTSGRLKQSQNRTNRAPLIDELMSSVPANTAGGVSPTPPGDPPLRVVAQVQVGRVVHIVRRDVAHDLPHEAQGLPLALRSEVRDPRLLR